VTDDLDAAHLRLERPAEGVARIVIDRPAVANALSSRFFGDLNRALDLIEGDDSIRVWLIAGAPRSDGRPCFSAGADMKEALHGLEPSEPTADPAALINRVDDMLKPSIAAIAGICTTGALELAIACDLRIAARSARLSDWHLRRTGLGIDA
jgi:enoyl-CoA hydratase/carnithine racemase